ncbi:MAG: hypothetical protein LBG60_16365 [Bifidobacteriaceae bacterium]|jgi:hypothetical protein|nr:hypothetical protein [Bifidobacteriaceae bacterium]
MRRTVDLKPALDVRVVDLAKNSGASISATLAGLVAAGLAAKNLPPKLKRDPRSGVATISIGRPLSIAQAKELARDDD